VYVHDRLTGATDLMSGAPGGAQVKGFNESIHQSKFASISGDGRYVTFTSDGHNLTPGDTNKENDIFLHDRGAEVLAKVSESGPLHVGSAVSVAQVLDVADRSSDVPALIRKEGGDIREVRLAFRPRTNDVFASLDLESLVHRPLPGMLYGLRFRAGGASYEVRAGRRVDASSGALSGRFGLWRCSGPNDVSCSEVTRLDGGYGTTGQAITFAIPLKALGGPTTSRLTDLSAYAALGTYEAGAVSRLDSLRIK
jgi:hypothetical protein